MVEFALVVPILLTLLLGVVELGWGLYTYHFLESAACQGTRYAIVRGADCTSWASACPASASDVQTFVRSLAPGAIDTSALKVTTTWTPDDTPGSEVSVTVQYNFSLDVPFVPSAVLAMKSASQMVISQ